MHRSGSLRKHHGDRFPMRLGRSMLKMNDDHVYNHLLFNGLGQAYGESDERSEFSRSERYSRTSGPPGGSDVRSGRGHG
jgi:hypothetical protein